MKSFQINKYLTLKLEENKTVIYVNGEAFDQCKYLFLINPNETIGKNFDSIDQVAVKFNRILEGEEISPSHLEITPEEEFWAHSSNIHSWAKYQYDTRILHSNLAFPLLRKLTEVGDPIAKKVFKEEIAKRLKHGIYQTIKFLEEDFVKYLSREEYYECVLSSYEEIQTILEIENLFMFKLKILDKLPEYPEYLEPSIIIKNKSITGIIVHNKNITKIPSAIKNLKNLEILWLGNNKLTEIPDSLFNLKRLKLLDLSNNYLKEIPDSIGNLLTLRNLYLYSNQIKILPNSIGNLQSLKILLLDDNLLENIPDSIKKLKNLERLDISENPLV